MSSWKKRVTGSLVALLLTVSGNFALAGAELNKAVQLYYEGKPEEAISAIRSLAEAGDAEAQYTLGNILYGLAEANKHM